MKRHLRLPALSLLPAALLGAWLAPTAAPAADHGRIADAFDEAILRCRAPVETGDAFDASGYAPAGEGRWRIPDTPFEMSFSRAPNEAGAPRAICRLTLVEGEILPVPLQGALLRRFMMGRIALVAKGTHEFRDPDPGYPMVSVGYGPVAPGVSGCPVIVGLHFLPDGSFLMASIGDQMRGCR